MRDFIKKTIANKKANGELTSLTFATSNEWDDDQNFGSIQFRDDWRTLAGWSIFFNSKCIHHSKTLPAAIKKLESLFIQHDLKFEDEISL